MEREQRQKEIDEYNTIYKNNDEINYNKEDEDIVNQISEKENDRKTNKSQNNYNMKEKENKIENDKINNNSEIKNEKKRE